jgi:hypothetical protein
VVGTHPRHGVSEGTDVTWRAHRARVHEFKVVRSPAGHTGEVAVGGMMARVIGRNPFLCPAGAAIGSLRLDQALGSCHLLV